MKINFFHYESHLFPFRWFIIFALCIAGLMFYADFTGWRMFYSSGQQQWNAGGRGYHK